MMPRNTLSLVETVIGAVLLKKIAPKVQYYAW